MILNWKTEKRKVSDLKYFGGNPREMTEKQAGDLLKSIKKFNLVEIPAIDTNNRVIAGNMRIEALKKLGKENEVIDVRVPNRELTEEEAKEYLIRSNKNTGQWDFDLLANFNEDLLKEIGFESIELDKIFQLDIRPEDDDVPDTRTTDIKLGDMFQLGEHRLLCGDSTKKEDVERLMQGEAMKMIFTSPPYNMNSGMYANYEDNLKSEEYINFNLSVLNNFKHFLRGFVFWNISYNKNARWEFIEILHRIIKDTGLKFLELIVWDKGHALPITSKEGLTRQYEDILLTADSESIEKDLELFYCGRNDKRAWFNKQTQRGITNYWRIGTNNTQLEEHLACFPVALPMKAIILMTNREDKIADSFGGSGSTLIACEKLNRKCRMMEIDPVYSEVICERWEKYTGGKRVKL